MTTTTTTTTEDDDIMSHCRDKPWGEKYGANYGPVRAIHSRPLWVVAGTTSDDDVMVEAMWESALYLAHLHYITTFATVRVFRDNEVGVEEVEEAGVNVVVVGDVRENRLYREIWEEGRRKGASSSSSSSSSSSLSSVQEVQSCGASSLSDDEGQGGGRGRRWQLLPSLSVSGGSSSNGSSSGGSGNRSIQIGPLEFSSPGE